jgi:hypothetical protein
MKSEFIPVSFLRLLVFIIYYVKGQSFHTWFGLFPAEDTEGNDIDYYRPAGHNGNLGAKVCQAGVFGNN